MKPSRFAYHAATSVDEALEVLAEFGPDANALSGGQSLIPMMNFRLARPVGLVDLNAIPGLAYIRDEPEQLVVGALTRHRALEQSAVVAAQVPLLAEAVPHIGHVQIRNRGTVGGSVAHADPAAEIPAVLTAMAGEVELTNSAGLRVVPADQFFKGYYTTAVEPGELVTAVRFPSLPAEWGWSFVELARRPGDFCVVAAAVGVLLDERGVVADARLALCGAGDRPLRLRAVESALVGQPSGADAYAAAADLARRNLEPHETAQASAAYRRDMVAVIVARALGRAARRAGAVGVPRSVAPNHGVRANGPPVASPPGDPAASDPSVIEPGTGTDRRAVRCTVNRSPQQALVEPRRMLSDYLRHDLGLTGTHVGCEHGVCGACTVLVDGEAVRSCLFLAVQAAGRSITTIEGIEQAGVLHPLQAALRDRHGLQCGFCTPGVIMTMTAFLRQNVAPAEDEIREALGGNICRCTGYVQIVEAVKQAATELATQTSASADIFQSDTRVEESK
jgi:xanthine dehydrogenase iron-sulfur cluster and FAD-binding subunit A